MRRYLLPSLVLLIVSSLIGLYVFNRFWIHRYDNLIERHASVYRLDPHLVWSVIYEETYFRAWETLHIFILLLTIKDETDGYKMRT